MRIIALISFYALVQPVASLIQPNHKLFSANDANAPYEITNSSEAGQRMAEVYDKLQTWQKINTHLENWIGSLQSMSSYTHEVHSYYYAHYEALQRDVQRLRQGKPHHVRPKGEPRFEELEPEALGLLELKELRPKGEPEKYGAEPAKMSLIEMPPLQEMLCDPYDSQCKSTVAHYLAPDENRKPVRIGASASINSVIVVPPSESFSYDNIICDIQSNDGRKTGPVQSSLVMTMCFFCGTLSIFILGIL